MIPDPGAIGDRGVVQRLRKNRRDEYARNEIDRTISRSGSDSERKGGEKRLSRECRDRSHGEERPALEGYRRCDRGTVEMVVPLGEVRPDADILIIGNRP